MATHIKFNAGPSDELTTQGSSNASASASARHELFEQREHPLRRVFNHQTILLHTYY